MVNEHGLEISNAAREMGRKGGQVKSERKAAAVRENGKRGGRKPAEWRKSRFASRLHRDGTVTYWDVYAQSWLRSAMVPDSAFATMITEEREAILKHLGPQK